MFTGIIETTGVVTQTTENEFGLRLLIDGQGLRHTPGHGDSIAVNGVCLTHAPDSQTPDGLLAFDVIRETLELTNLGKLTEGSGVNLESSLRADTPLAGHFVQGHVDAMGVVSKIESSDEEWRLTIGVPTSVMPFVVPKGSIAIDGVSLTIAAVDGSTNQFTVALIPTTLAITTMNDYAEGDTVNLESDMIVRSVVHYMMMQGR